jgi:hypothetical protein
VSANFIASSCSLNGDSALARFTSATSTTCSPFLLATVRIAGA